MISLIAAIASNRALGKGNKLIYAIPEDLKRFRKITSNHPIIMGRKTFESVGRPLPNRTNIVVTSNKRHALLAKRGEQVTRDIKIVNSLEDAIQEAKNSPGSEEIFIIGGGQIFEQSINLADKLYLTIIEDNPEADTFFPDYSDFKKVVAESEWFEYQGIKYKFLELER